MTTILIKKKDTAGAPAPGDLTNAAGGAEIAVNTATKRIYSKDSSNAIIEMGTFPSSMAVQGTLSATGATTLNGAVTLGDAAADNITVNGTITSNLLFTDNTYDIGAAAATRPRNLFLSSSATVDAQVAFGRAGVVRGYAGFYPSNGFAWFYIRNGNDASLEFSTGAAVGTDVAFTLAALGGTSNLRSNLVFSADNTYDIGASGATRPRSIYVGSGITAPVANLKNGQQIFRGGNTGSGGYRYWKIGTWIPNADSDMAEITVWGAVGYSAGQPIEGKTTILLRRNNSSVSVGIWSYTGAVGSTGPTGARINSSTGDVYLLLGNFFQLQENAIFCDNDSWTTSYVDTGSGSAPASTTALVNQQMFGNNSAIAIDYANNVVSIGTPTFNTARKLYVYGGDILAENAGVNVAVGLYSNGGSGRAYYMVSDTTGAWQLYDNNATANRITVNSSGLVGINTTPKTWQGGISVLQLGGQASWSYGGGTNMVLGNNRYFNSGDKFIGNGNYASQIEMSNGAFAFGYSTVVGTADALITWNYGLAINQTGQVVVPGISSATIPSATAGYALDVRGNTLAYKASGNTSVVAATGTNANAAMNAVVNFGVEFNTDASFTSYAWSKGSVRKMWLIANDSGSSSLGVGISNPQAYSINGSRCAIVANQPIVSNDSVYSRFMSRGFIMQDTGGSTSWTKFGTFSTSQGGYMCRIRYTGHVGFNADIAQLGMCEIQFSTANNSASQAGSTGAFFGAFQAFRLGRANVMITVRVVQITTDQYDIWGYVPNYSNGGYYEVSFSDGTSWTHSGAIGTPSGNFVDITPNTITYT